ncbi:sensor histidine kinase [Reichenbachiella versicolor]|uniref:sensor histidine kinase n=1 Tax=Reichenbachiella versicolor TaxID=1821036 RepID=UPI000D6E429F|nr:HAMP domain-containing sensor histidine kinase [Reichenbachiella versicolor]
MSTAVAIENNVGNSSVHFFWTNYVNPDHVELLTPQPLFAHLTLHHPYALTEFIDKRDYQSMVNYFSNLEIDSPPTHCYLKRIDNHIRQVSCTSIREEKGIKTLWSFNSDDSNNLLTAAAHDLRSPINSVLGLTNVIQIMLNEPKVEKKELTRIIDLMKVSCKNVLDFTEDLLELSEIESGTYQLKTEEVRINEFIDTFISTNRFESTKKKIAIQKVSKINENDTFHINRSKITRVLSNLLSNAIKFSNQSESIYIKILKNEIGQLEIQLIDQGVGMTKEVLENLFVKFGKSKRLGLDGEKSHGLGMSIVKQIIEMHGGQILVSSEENQGTVARLIFTH